MIPFCRVNWPPALGLREKAAKGLQQETVLVTINWKTEKSKTGEIQIKKFALNQQLYSHGAVRFE